VIQKHKPDLKLVRFFYALNLTDPNSPGYVTPASRAAWYPDGHTYNYADTGLSQYRIDLADLMFWVEESPWCWCACWLEEPGQPQQMMAAGGDMMMSGFMELETVSEPTVQEQIAQLVSAIVSLEQLRLEPEVQQEIDSAVWGDFMNTLYQELIDRNLETQ
jgi:hypothetical protein